MVRKLYKHEFLSWLRVLPLIYAITLLTATFHRVLQIFETDSIYYTIVNVSALVLYAVSILVCLAAPMVFGVVRFYKNLFTGEGYLSFTLPVNTTTHLNVKVITPVVFSLISMLVCALSACIITAGEVFTELWNAAGYLWKQVPAMYQNHIAGYIAEFCVLWIVALFASVLLYNSCVCIGQLAKKNRIPLAVGSYFIYYFISQILSTVMIIVLTGMSMTGKLDPYIAFIDKHPLATVHIFLWGGIVLTGLLALAFWLVCRFILHRKLNLE